MKTAICQYSFSRTLRQKDWNCEDFANAAKQLGVDGIDFHTLYIGMPDDAPRKIRHALEATGLELSGLSLSNNFNKEKIEEFRQQIDYVKEWIVVASKIEAPICRIFGGHIIDRTQADMLDAAFVRIIDGLSEVVKEAEKYGVVLAIENHGGLPCTGREQVNVIRKINSKNLLATIDVGNYMQGGEEGHIGTAIASKYAAYVHFKDFKKQKSDKTIWGWEIEPCTLSDGEVDHLACLQELKKDGYNGFIALEYEGLEDELIAVPKNVRIMKNLIHKVLHERSVDNEFSAAIKS